MLNILCLILLLGLAALTGCTQGAPATVVPFASGGLGLTKAAWEQPHTLTPTTEPDPDGAFLYDAGEYQIYFWNSRPAPGGDARIYMLRRALVTGLPDAAARVAARELLPVDAQLQCMVPLSDAGASFVEIYQSAALASRYPAGASPDPWRGETPGSFWVTYWRTAGAVQVLWLVTGHGVEPLYRSPEPRFSWKHPAPARDTLRTRHNEILPRPTAEGT